MESKGKKSTKKRQNKSIIFFEKLINEIYKLKVKIDQNSILFNTKEKKSAKNALNEIISFFNIKLNFSKFSRT